MGTFAVSSSDSQAEIISALNYALSNLGTSINNGNVIPSYGNVVTANTVTGALSSVDSGVIGYLNGFVNIKYANTSTGGSGFSSNSTGASYYGVDNTTAGTISTNPTDYSWTQVSGGFGTTKGLWYETLGGQQIRFFAGNTASVPGINYRPVEDNTAIALITLANSVVVSNSVATAAITTTKIQESAATQVLTQADNTPYPLLNWVNGNATVGGEGYKWPNYTRGVPISSAITTTTDGSSTGSAITVNWNTYLYSDIAVSSYNLVELWKTGGDSFYQKTFNTVRCFAGPAGPVGGPFTAEDGFSIPGDNGSLYNGNIGNIVTQLTGTTNDLYDGYSMSVEDGGAFNMFGAAGQFSHSLGGTPTAGNIAYIVTAVGGTGSAYPLFDMRGQATVEQLNSPSIYVSTIIVGTDGQIAFWVGKSTEYFNGLFAFESSGTLADLNDIACDWAQNNDVPTAGTAVNYVAVGQSGTLLYNTRSYNTTGNVSATTGWSQAVSGTVNNLNAVSSNPTLTINTTIPYIDSGTAGNTWVVVGDAGTVLRSNNISGPWTQANTVPTINNLNAVAYANGYWVAVGDAGTVLYSTDTDNWTQANVVAASDRNLYGVAGGYVSGRFVIAGQEIILTSDTNNVATTTWANTYIGGSSLSTELTRVQFFGSWANVANVSEPPVQQRVSNGQIVSGTFTDVDYTADQTITYYLVVGNMSGNANVYTNSTSITVTEIKR